MAIAMAKCWMATWTRRAERAGIGSGLPPTDSFHVEECAFCDMPRDMIIRALDEFVEWSGISSYDESVPLRLEIESWETVSSTEQTRRVAKASGMNMPDRGADPQDRRSPW
jgi:hypothetical protein